MRDYSFTMDSPRNHSFERDSETKNPPRLREYVVAVMKQNVAEQQFSRRTSVYQKQNLLEHIKKKSWSGPPSEVAHANTPYPQYSNGQQF